MPIQDNNNNVPKSCSRLEEIAEKARLGLISQNVYQNENNKRYGVTHPNATQETGGIDDRTNAKGKGTGEYMDTTNGGGDADINGRADVAGSGRKRLLQNNKYSKDNPYDCFIP